MAVNDSQVRIVAGQWRGRKITFNEGDGLRPTPDRVRETLFSWLQADIINAVCLDLFAGSGALGLEALSRGAEYVDSVDNDRQVVEYLQQLWKRFEIVQGKVFKMDYRSFLKQCENSYHIVFIDPPFHQSMASAACKSIEQVGLLKNNALVYVETHIEEQAPLMFNSQLIREKVMGDVKAMLWRKN